MASPAAHTAGHPAAGPHGQKHPYHLVDPSPWPAFGALSASAWGFGGAWGALISVLALGCLLTLWLAWSRRSASGTAEVLSHPAG